MIAKITVISDKLIMFFSLFAAFASSERSFRIEGNEFMLDGKAFRYVSGSFHYYRQVPEYWEESIKKMANCGLNTVCTYVAWNIHEPEPGVFNWEGLGDLERFINICQNLGMYVILRPGPFICAEWEGGGFPYWLQNLGISNTRRSDEKFLKAVDEWFNILLPKMKPHMYVNGGNIISVQVENEYGGAAAGCDKKYLEHMCDLIKGLLGDDTVLFTVDTAERQYLDCGSIPEKAFVTVDFPTTADPKAAFELQRSYNNGKGPYVDTEYYTGWIDFWGDKHHRVDVEGLIGKLDIILSLNASVNFYMFYGGTNFAWYAGANGDRSSYYSPDPTSYDYDAPLSESADMTWKYQRIRETVAKYYPQYIKNYTVANTTKRSYGTVQIAEGLTLLDHFDQVTTREIKVLNLKSFEKVKHGFGYINYRIQTNGGKLSFGQINDRAIIIVNGKYVDTLMRKKEHDVTIEAGQLDILVEELGRVNIGAFLDTKGLSSVKLNNNELTNWKMFPIDFDLARTASFESKLPVHGPAFYKATFQVDEIGDTFINPSGFRHGVILINGFNIGRHWEIGPQVNYYVPGTVLKKGANEILIFESDDISSVPSVTFEDKPKLDK